MLRFRQFIVIKLYLLANILSASVVSFAFQSAQNPVSMFRGGAERRGEVKTKGVEKNAKIKWTFQTNGVVRSSPIVAGRFIYIGSGDGSFYALDRKSGKLNWAFSTGSPVDSTAAISSGTVIVANRAGTIFAFNAINGKLKWKVQTGKAMPFEWGFEGWDYYNSSPAIVKNTVLIGSQDGHIYALDTRTGGEHWRFKTGGRVLSSPAFYKGLVFSGSADGSLYAIDFVTGKQRWRFDTRGRLLNSATFGFDRKTIQASPAVADSTVYFGSRDGAFYAIDAITGSQRWMTESGTSWVVSSAAVADGLVFSSRSDQHYINALRVSSGEEVWRISTINRKPVFSSPLAVGEILYVGCAGGILYAINKNTGAIRWQYRIGEAIYSSPAVADGDVFFGSDNGVVYALETSPGSVPRLAIFWDQALTNWQAILPAHEEVRRYFERWGYEVLDSQSLPKFMQERITDKVPSVIVFAMDLVPASIAPQVSANTLFRRYLNEGGKIIWLGTSPFLYTRDALGKITNFDREAPGKLLGVDHLRLNFDLRGIQTTAEGRKWGLTGWWTGTPGVDPNNINTILALDDTGGAAAWVKNYGGAPGTGFVQLWGGQTRLSFEKLEMARNVAEYGITQQIKSDK